MFTGVALSKKKSKSLVNPSRRSQSFRYTVSLSYTASLPNQLLPIRIGWLRFLAVLLFLSFNQYTTHSWPFNAIMNFKAPNLAYLSMCYLLQL